MRIRQALNWPIRAYRAMDRFVSRCQHAVDLHRRGFSWKRSVQLAWSWI